MKRWPVPGRLSLFSMALPGVVAGHALVYFLALGGGHAQEAILEETGHGYWPGAVAAAVVLGLWSAVALFARHFLCRRAGVGPAGQRMLPLLLRLILLQTAMFISLEVGERMAAGSSLEHLFHQHVLTLGVLVQFVVALAVALILRLLARTAELLVTILRRRRLPFAAVVGIRPHPVSIHRAFLLEGAWGVRGPPTRY